MWRQVQRSDLKRADLRRKAGVVLSYPSVVQAGFLPKAFQVSGTVSENRALGGSMVVGRQNGVRLKLNRIPRYKRDYTASVSSALPSRPWNPCTSIPRLRACV